MGYFLAGLVDLLLNGTKVPFLSRLEPTYRLHEPAYINPKLKRV